MRKRYSPEAVAAVVASELRHAYRDHSGVGSWAEDHGGGGSCVTVSGHQDGGGSRAEAIAAIVASELRRRDYKGRHRGAGDGAIHVGGGEGKGGEDDGGWATDIYPGAVFKRGGS